MLNKPPQCSGCPLYGSGRGFSEPVGTGSLGLLIVGEQLNELGEQLGFPLPPASDGGSVLERALRRSGYSRDQMAIWSTIACRPPGDILEGTADEAAAVEHCRTHLDRVVAQYKPKAILALGPMAFRSLTGMAGPKQGVMAARGFIIPSYRYDLPVIGGYDPAFLRFGKMSLLGALIHDLQLAVSVAQHGAPPQLPIRYREYPTQEDAKAFLEEVRSNPQLPLAYDIETAYTPGLDEEEREISGKQIVLVQFSLRPGEGIAMPWMPGYIEIIREILALPNVKLAFNGWLFDNPVLALNDAPVSGTVHDLMWAFHHLQPDLPRNIQFAASFYDPAFGPWKHLAASNLNNYGCRDVDILQRMWPKIERDLRLKGVWRGYERHVLGLRPILRGMEQRGLPGSVEERDKFSAELGEEMAKLDARMQELYPEELKGLDPKNGFVRDPAETAGLVRRTFIAKHKVKQFCSCVDQESGEISGWTKKVATRCAACKGSGLIKAEVTGPVERWARLNPFKPSQDQMIRYMRHMGHPVPKKIGEDRDSVERLGVERLFKKTQDPFYRVYLDFKRAQKVKSSYVDGWKIHEDGRIHPTITFSPATGQLAAKDPNVMTSLNEKKIGNLGNLGNLAKRFRRIIAAQPGHVIVEFDFSAFHALTLAFEAQDPVYARIARIDPHSFLAARMLRLNTPDKMMAMPDDELTAFLSDVKKKHGDTRDGKAKPAILGFGFCLGAKKMYEMNEESFDSQAETKLVVETLRGCFPGVVKFQNAIRLIAHKQCFLYNKHGYIRWFWDVLRNNQYGGGTEFGEQAQEAVAFLPACDAHGHIKDALIRMDQRGWLERYGLINIVHDAVVFECPISLLEEMLFNIKTELERPSDILIDPVVAPNGLVVKVEGKVGPQWMDMVSPEKYLGIKEELPLAA